MFEDSLMESGGKLKTKSKYWSIVTLCINGAILAGLIIWPLLHPEALPTQIVAPQFGCPPPPPPHPDDGHPVGCPTTPTAPSPATTTSGSGPGQDQV